MRRKNLWAVVAVAAVLTSGFVYAERSHGDRADRPMMGRRGGNEMMFDRLDLSSEQRDQIRGIRFAHRKTNIQRRSHVELKHVELQELLGEDSPNMRQVESKLREIADLKVQLHLSRIQTRLSIRQLLTDEQRERMGNHGPGMGDGRGRHHQGAMDRRPGW